MAVLLRFPPYMNGLHGLSQFQRKISREDNDIIRCGPSKFNTLVISEVGKGSDNIMFFFV